MLTESLTIWPPSTSPTSSPTILSSPAVPQLSFCFLHIKTQTFQAFSCLRTFILMVRLTSHWLILPIIAPLHSEITSSTPRDPSLPHQFPALYLTLIFFIPFCAIQNYMIYLLIVSCLLKWKYQISIVVCHTLCQNRVGAQQLCVEQRDEYPQGCLSISGPLCSFKAVWTRA